MSTIAIQNDLRRTDQRSNVRYNPFWVSSKTVSYEDVAATTKAALLFSFPTAVGTYYLVHAAYIITTIIAGSSPGILVGTGTLATDAVTTGGDITVVTANSIVVAGDVTEATAALVIGTGVLATNVLSSTTICSHSAANLITCADSTVPCIYASNSGTATSGSFKVYIMMSKLPV